MKKISNNYLKPQHYYNRLFFFFLLLSISLTITFNHADLSLISIDTYLLQTIIFFFLLMTISVFIEHFHKGDYISPIEVYDVEMFFKNFQKDLYKSELKNYIHKYDYKTKQNIENIVLRKKVKFFLSTIRKESDVYELTIINEYKFFQYFLIKFLVKKAIHKLFIKKIKNEFKIIRFI